jgi:hypothetical protein
MKNDAEVVGRSDVLVLKIGTCESLSGRSVLTYHIGYNGAVPSAEESAFRNGIQVRIHGNSGKGLFSDDWVPFSALQAVLATEDSEMPVSSASLNSIFAGKSANTAGFLLAVLKAEGLVKQMEEKKRCYVCVKSDTFSNEIWELASSVIPLTQGEHDDPSSKPDQKGKGRKGQ